MAKDRTTQQTDMTERLLADNRGADDKQLRWLHEASVAPIASSVAAKTKNAGGNNNSNNPKSSLPAAARQYGRLHLASVLISLSSFMWGYGAAVLNVCIVPDAVGSMLHEINLSTSEQETATALVVVGALVSALATGGIGERIGQKKTILANNVFYIVGALVCALALSKTAIYIGRFCIGYVFASHCLPHTDTSIIAHVTCSYMVLLLGDSIGSGIVTNTVPILLNEISPAQIRGQITSYHQLSLTLGILATGILGFFIITDVPSGWRVRPPLASLCVARVCEHGKHSRRSCRCSVCST